MKTRALILPLCSLVLATVTVLGTIAYLTDSDEAVNTFTVGQVDISLDECAVTPAGVPIADAARVKSNEYHLIPGQTYTKDPMITVAAGSEESYIRILVTINKAAELKAIFGDNFLPQNYVAGWDSSVWISTGVITSDTAANTLTYEFRYFDTVDGSDGALKPLFTSFTLPGEIDGAELSTIAGMKITVIGHAIQKAGFDTADTAWAEFAAQVSNSLI